MTTPGWYPDPNDRNRQRYWDGRIWADHIQSPPQSNLAAGPLTIIPPPGPSDRTIGNPNSFNNVGDWIKRTVRAMRHNLKPVLIFNVGLVLPGWILSYFLFDRLLDGMQWHYSEPVVRGFDQTLGALTVLAVVTTVLITWIVRLATSHLLYGVHVNAAPTWTESFAVGFRRLPRFAGLLLLRICVLAGISLVSIVLSGWVAGNNSYVGSALDLLAYLTALSAHLLFMVKLGPVDVAVAVNPSKASALSSSLNISKGRFWAVSGRILLLILTLNFTVGIVVTAVLIGFGLHAIWWAYGDWEFFGQIIEVQELGELLPDPIWGFPMIVLLGLALGLGRVISASAFSALYADAKAPNNFGHS